MPPRLSTRWLWLLLTLAACALFISLGRWQWSRGEHRAEQWREFEASESTGAGTQDANFNDAGVAVYPFDRAWQGPVALFGLSSAYTVNGVAFDPSNNSLWLQGASQFDTGTSHFVADDTMDGTLRSSCDDSSLDGFGGHALAMRDADGTLWSIYGPGSKFGQWSTTGTFLQSLNSDAFAGGLSTASGVRFRAGSRSGGADSFRRRTGSTRDHTLSPAPLRDGLVHAINTGVRTLG